MVKPFYKPLDRPEREEIWYCYLNEDHKKQSSKPLKEISISQVPDLTIEKARDASHLQKIIKPGRVREADSKYVKLAKAGGRKDLLCYRENQRKNIGPMAYKVPEWYYHDDKASKEEKELSEEEKHKKYKVTYGKRSYKTQERPKTYERPDYMTHLGAEEIRDTFGKSERIPDSPIFGYDRFSFWKRDELEKLNKLPLVVPEVKLERRQKKTVQSIGQKEGRAKKKVKLPANPGKVQVSGHRKLASSGYATKWHEKWYVQALKNWLATPLEQNCDLSCMACICLEQQNEQC